MSSNGKSVFVRVPLALLALVAAGAGQWFLSVSYQKTWSALCWSAAAALFLFLLADRKARLLPEPEEGRLPPRVEWPLFALVLALGIFFRVYRLDLIPAGLNHDAAWNGLYALRILLGEPYTPYVSEAWGRETLMHWLQAASIWMTGPTTLGVILPAIASAILLLPLFYLWMREMFGARTALLATALLACSGWHLVFARVGWRVILQPTVSVIAYLFFARGLRTRSLVSFALAGAGAAGAVYTYNAARAVPLLFPVFALYRLAIEPQRKDFLRRYWLGGTVMIVAFLVVVAPMAYYAATHWIQWQGRAVATFMQGATLWGNVKGAALMYSYWGNGDDFFIHEPLLEYPAAVLLAFGALWCLLRPFDERALFLVLGFLVNLLPGLVSKPNGNRAFGTLPFIYAFAALGLVFFWRELSRVRRGGARLATALVVAVTASCAVATYLQYFGPNRRQVQGFYPETTVLGRYMRTLVPDYTIWVGGANFPRDTLTFLTYPGTGHPETKHYRWVNNITQLPQIRLVPEGGKGMAFLLPSFSHGPWVLKDLQQRFPEHETVELRTRVGAAEQVFARGLLVHPEAAAKEVMPPSTQPAAAVPPSSLFGARRGSAPGQLHDPKGIAIGPGGEIYVADTGNNRVQSFSAGEVLQRTWGSRGTATGRFDEPTAIAVDADGNVHVVDTWNHRVQKFRPDGELVRAYQRSPGFFGPRGIAIGVDRIYVTDGGNNVIAVFELSGRFLSDFGKKGDREGELFQPVGVVVDGAGTVWVVDSGNNRLQQFAPDGKSLRTVPVPDWSGPDLKEAYLAVAADGSLLLTDPVNRKLLRLRGDQFEVVASGLEGPTGIAVHGNDCYVTERGPARVKKLDCEHP